MTRGFTPARVLIDEVRVFQDAHGVGLSGFSLPDAAAILREYRTGPLVLPSVPMPAPVRLEDIDFKVMTEAMKAPAVSIDEMVRQIMAAKASFSDYAVSVRRRRLIAEVLARYGVTLHPHPRLVHVVVVSRSDYEALMDGIDYDPARVPLVNGHLLFMGEAITVRVMPDWTCDRVSVALARSIAVGLSAPRRAARVAAAGLTRMLSRGGVA